MLFWLCLTSTIVVFTYPWRTFLFTHFFFYLFLLYSAFLKKKKISKWTPWTSSRVYRSFSTIWSRPVLQFITARRHSTQWVSTRAVSKDAGVFRPNRCKLAKSASSPSRDKNSCIHDALQRDNNFLKRKRHCDAAMDLYRNFIVACDRVLRRLIVVANE